jgi:hypothetical protein
MPRLSSYLYPVASGGVSPTSSQIIAVNIIYLAVAAQSSDAGIACSENPVYFFTRQLASATTTQYSIRHN